LIRAGRRLYFHFNYTTTHSKNTYRSRYYKAELVITSYLQKIILGVSNLFNQAQLDLSYLIWTKCDLLSARRWGKFGNSSVKQNLDAELMEVNSL
jgi:hypothetical protein